MATVRGAYFQMTEGLTTARVTPNSSFLRSTSPVKVSRKAFSRSRWEGQAGQDGEQQRACFHNVHHVRCTHQALRMHAGTLRRPARTHDTLFLKR